MVFKVSKSSILLSRFEGVKLKATNTSTYHESTESIHLVKSAVRPWEDHGKEWLRGSGTE